MNTKLAQLPKTPPWKVRTIRVEGTDDDIELFHRDGLELYKFLRRNPLFSGHQNNVPSRIWEDYENDIRILSEPMTCEFVNNIQVCHDNDDTVQCYSLLLMLNQFHCS